MHRLYIVQTSVNFRLTLERSIASSSDLYHAMDGAHIRDPGPPFLNSL